MILKKDDILFDIIFAVLLFMLPLSMAVPNISLAILFLLFILKRDKKNLKTVYLKLIYLFVLFLVLKALINQTFLSNINFYKHLFSLLGLSILTVNIKNPKIVKTGFILGVLTAVIISCIKIIAYYIEQNIIPLGNTVEAKNLLLIDRPYLGFMCFLAILLLSEISKRKKQNVIYNTGIIFFIIFVYLIVARLSLLLIILFLLVKTVEKFKSSKIKLALLLSSIVIGTFILLSVNKNFQKRLHIKTSVNETVKVLKNQEPRFVIWNCVFHQISKPEFNIFLGYKSFQTIEHNLSECYNNSIENESKKEYFFKTKFNTHNQFFDIFLQGGIIGLLLFLSLFGYSFYIFRDYIIPLLVILAFLLFSIIENILHRQYGVYLFAIFIPLVNDTFYFRKR